MSLLERLTFLGIYSNNLDEFFRETLGIRTEDNMYATALHVYELYDNALANAKGRYIEDEIYQVDKSAANEFDKRFPPKEIIVGTPSQKRFDQIVVMRRKAI